MEVNKEMTIIEVLNTAPGVAEILQSAGMHCLGCALASGENLEQACMVHGIDADALITAINDYLETL